MPSGVDRSGEELDELEPRGADLSLDDEPLGPENDAGDDLDLATDEPSSEHGVGDSVRPSMAEKSAHDPLAFEEEPSHDVAVPMALDDSAIERGASSFDDEPMFEDANGSSSDETIALEEGEHDDDGFEDNANHNDDLGAAGWSEDAIDDVIDEAALPALDASHDDRPSREDFALELPSDSLASDRWEIARSTLVPGGIVAVCADRAGFVAIGAELAIVGSSGGPQRTVRIAGETTALALDGERAWVATSEALWELDRATATVRRSSPIRGACALAIVGPEAWALVGRSARRVSSAALSGESIEGVSALTKMEGRLVLLRSEPGESEQLVAIGDDGASSPLVELAPSDDDESAGRARMLAGPSFVAVERRGRLRVWSFATKGTSPVRCDGVLAFDGRSGVDPAGLDHVELEHAALVVARHDGARTLVGRLDHDGVLVGIAAVETASIGIVRSLALGADGSTVLVASDRGLFELRCASEH
jgi:hypothetical protein